MRGSWTDRLQGKIKDSPAQRIGLFWARWIPGIILLIWL